MFNQEETEPTMVNRDLQLLAAPDTASHQSNEFVSKPRKRRVSSLGSKLRGTSIIIGAVIVWMNCSWMFMVSNNNSSNMHHHQSGKDGDGAVSTIMLEQIKISTTRTSRQHNSDDTTVGSENDDDDKESAVRLLFVIGLEGTGHHLLQQMASQSPAIDRLKEMEIFPLMTKRLGKLLYNDPHHHHTHRPTLPHAIDHGSRRGSEALVAAGAAAAAAIPRPPTLWGSMESCGSGDTHHPQPGGKADSPSVEEKAVKLLQAIEHKAKSAQEHDNNGQQEQRIVTIPFNVLRTLFTMVSYPHLQGPCRALRYPDLDVWYHVCDLAGVRCEHVYIHRDPYEILFSTNVKRQNNRNKSRLYTIHLYKSMLNIIYAQLSVHASRTVGCYGMFDRGTTNATAAGDQWKYQVGDLLGWSDKQAYDEFFESEYSPPKPNANLTRYKREFDDDPAFASAMKSLVDLNDRVKQLCESIARIPEPVLVAAASSTEE